MSEIKERLKRAKRRQTTVEVCLRGDLAGEYEHLEQQLAKLPKSDRLGGDPERQRIQADMEQLRADMQADTIPFKLQALAEPEFQALFDLHPPRRDGDEVDPRDADAGFNRATFYRPLIQASVIDPELDGDDWQVLFDEGLSPGEFYRLGLACLRINGQQVDVPFSSDASNGNPDS